MYCRALVLPPAGLARAIHLAALAEDGAEVYQRDDGSIVEARTTWPPETAGLTLCPSPIPPTWTRLTPAPS